jgi:hypothetical protein
MSNSHKKMISHELKPAEVLHDFNKACDVLIELASSTEDQKNFRRVLTGLQYAE